MKRFFVGVFVVLLLSVMQMIVPKEAEARCVCACVDGKKQNICSSTLDLKIPCFGICPLKTPSLKPLKPLGLNPLGTTTCKMKQVYNYYTMRYEWKKICW